MTAGIALPKRISRLFATALLGTALLASGCTPTQSTTETPAAEVELMPVKIGVLPTEDSLPLWAAEEAGYFAEEGLPSVELVPFQSAQERDVAFTSGAIDAFMGDMIAVANLEAAGTECSILTVMLGADQSQGRFGIVVAPGSDITSLEQLAGVPVGTSSATIQEYVLDGLMAEAGVPADQVKVEEVKKVPVRFELLMNGQLKAAALPEPFLSLAEKDGAVLVGDDTKAETNLSQTVMVFSDAYLSREAGSDSADAVLKAWDRGVADVNADPDAFRNMLVEQARMPEALAESYAINTYPTRALPAKDRVDAVLEWMRDKGYLSADVTYESLTLITPPSQ